MNKNKLEICYILKFSVIKRRTQRWRLKFMVVRLYQIELHINGSLAFVREISMPSLEKVDWIIGKIEPFLKRMVTGDEKWIKYDSNVLKRSWSKQGEASQTVVKLGLAPRRVMKYGLLQPSRAFCLPSRQRQTIHIFDGSAKNERAWLGNVDASTI